MKGISLWEPWASLIQTRAKKIETRGRQTKYRGPLVICASKGGLRRHELNELLKDQHFKEGLMPLLRGKHHNKPQRSDLNFGKAVALVNLYNCKSTQNCKPSEIGSDIHFGDFRPGRFAWFLEFIEALDFPVSGSQGFFNVKMPAGKQVCYRCVNCHRWVTTNHHACNGYVNEYAPVSEKAYQKLAQRKLFEGDL